MPLDNIEPFDEHRKSKAEDLRMRVKLAFRALRKKHYLAEQNFLCCRTCATAAMQLQCSQFAHHAAKTGDPPKVGFVYYTADDENYLHANLMVHVSWHGQADEVRSALEAEGLSVDWDGADATRMLVKIPIIH